MSERIMDGRKHKLPSESWRPSRSSDWEALSFDYGSSLKEATAADPVIRRILKVEELEDET